MADDIDRVIYFDYNASTPCDPRAVEAMMPYFLECYANPANQLHRIGRRAARAVEDARRTIAESVNAQHHEVVFTSGATESNNLSISGAIALAPPSRRRVITSTVEHKCVLETCRAASKQGYELTVAPVGDTGTIDLGALVDLVDDQTALVSIQSANNEIGTIQPTPEIAQIVHRVGATFHVDAAQSLGRVPIDVKAWDADLVSFSSHKVYGPKGVGALYVRGGANGAPVAPLLFGGGQEHGLRPGTSNVPGVVGFARAVELTVQAQSAEAIRLGHLRDYLEHELITDIPRVTVNGNTLHRLPSLSSLTLEGVEAEALLVRMPGFALGTGSACTSGAQEPSHVLTAIGLTRDEAYSTVRVGLGRLTTKEDVDALLSELAHQASEIRALMGVTA